MWILDSADRVQGLAGREVEDLDALLRLRSGEQPMTWYVDRQMVAVGTLRNIWHYESLHKLQRLGASCGYTRQERQGQSCQHSKSSQPFLPCMSLRRD